MSLITEYTCCGQPVQEIRTDEGRWLECTCCRRAGYERKLPKSDAEQRALDLARKLIRAGYAVRVRVSREPAFWDSGRSKYARQGQVTATVGTTGGPGQWSDHYTATYLSKLRCDGFRASTRYVKGTVESIGKRPRQLSQPRLTAAVARELRTAEASGRIAAREPETGEAR